MGLLKSAGTRDTRLKTGPGVTLSYLLISSLSRMNLLHRYLYHLSTYLLPTFFRHLLQDLEEELELDRRRVSEAESVAKRAEEELAVAKERLLLQEDELQNRAGME